jgi:hypothetical protein
MEAEIQDHLEEVSSCIISMRLDRMIEMLQGPEEVVKRGRGKVVTMKERLGQILLHR